MAFASIEGVLERYIVRNVRNAVRGWRAVERFARVSRRSWGGVQEKGDCYINYGS